MVFEWKEFHEVGNYLKQFPREAYQRSAVGRYYYACYHLVKKYYEHKFFYLGFQENPHETLIKCLRFYGNDLENDLADALSDLRDYRNKADYYQGFRHGIFRKAEKATEDIFKLLDDLNHI